MHWEVAPTDSSEAARSGVGDADVVGKERWGWSGMDWDKNWEADSVEPSSLVG